MSPCESVETQTKPTLEVITIPNELIVTSPCCSSPKIPK